MNADGLTLEKYSPASPTFLRRRAIEASQTRWKSKDRSIVSVRACSATSAARLSALTERLANTRGNSILASASPRRRELLHALGIDFESESPPED